MTSSGGCPEYFSQTAEPLGREITHLKNTLPEDSHDFWFLGTRALRMDCSYCGKCFYRTWSPRVWCGIDFGRIAGVGVAHYSSRALGPLFRIYGSLTLGTMDVKHIKWKDLYWLWPLTIAGLGVGLFILRATEAEQLTRILGGFLLAYVFYLLLYKPNVRTVVPRIWGILFGFVGGVMGSMYGTGGPSLVAYLQLRQLSTRSLRATIQFVALTDNVMRGAGYVMLGLLTFPVFISALWLAAPTFLGIWIGNRIHRRIAPQYFEWGIIIILGLTGIKLLFGTFI